MSRSSGLIVWRLCEDSSPNEVTTMSIPKNALWDVQAACQRVSRSFGSSASAPVGLSTY